MRLQVLEFVGIELKGDVLGRARCISSDLLGNLMSQVATLEMRSQKTAETSLPFLMFDTISIRRWRRSDSSVTGLVWTELAHADRACVS
jgi:hypothetical protein